MRVLYVLPESIDTGGGGIATYHGHARLALENSGHETYLFSWSFDGGPEDSVARGPRIRIVPVTTADVNKTYSPTPFNAALSFYLLPELLRAISDFKPDVIESSDFLAPMYAYLVHKRAGLLPSHLSVPVVLYNHGMSRELYRANASFPDLWQRQECAAERSTMRWADSIFVPSNTALRKLQFQMGYTAHATVVREPYHVTKRHQPSTSIPARYVHMGRVSFAKGIDHVVHFLNVIEPHVPVNEVLLVGRVEGTSFKTYGARDYFLKRLSPRLRSRVSFAGTVAREKMRSVISPKGNGGFSLSFSEQETFNYAFLEMLEYGLVPFTHRETAMAEFFPESHYRCLIPSDFESSATMASVKEVHNRGKEFVEDVSDFAFKLSSPVQFAVHYERVVSSLNRKEMSRINRQYTSRDVTVLMATYNPTDRILNSIDSVRHQTAQPSLIVLEDGPGQENETADAILDKLGNDSNCLVVRSAANEGLCASRVKLVNACKTKLAVFLDDDDVLLPEYVEKVLDVFNSNTVGADAVFTWRRNFGESTELVINYNLEDYESLLSNDYRMTALIRTDVLRELGFVSSMRNGEADDWDFWVRFFNSGFRAVLLPEPLFQYNVRTGSMSWPWSKGQAALTSELIARQATSMLRSGSLPECFLLDLYCMLEDKHGNPTLERESFRELARRRPILGKLAYSMFRLSRSILKRSSN